MIGGRRRFATPEQVAEEQRQIEASYARQSDKLKRMADTRRAAQESVPVETQIAANKSRAHSIIFNRIKDVLLNNKKAAKMLGYNVDFIHGDDVHRLFMTEDKLIEKVYQEQADPREWEFNEDAALELVNMVKAEIKEKKKMMPWYKKIF